MFLDCPHTSVCSHVLDAGMYVLVITPPGGDIMDLFLVVRW